MGIAALAGQTALVAGAGRGIGAQLARWLAAAGADVTLLARTGSEVVALADELTADDGVRALPVVCDVADADTVARSVDEVVAELGRIDIAIADAAVLGPVGPITDVNPARWMDTQIVNVGGTMHLVRAVIPIMRRQGRGRILTLSGAGIGGPQLLERASAYVSSKAAIVVLTEVVSKELPAGIAINAIAPGAVPTTFMAEALEVGPGRAGAALFAAAGEDIPPDLERLRRLMLFLVSDGAAELTGRCLSSRWDDPDLLLRLARSGPTPSRFRLRRIDDTLFAEVG